MDPSKDDDRRAYHRLRFRAQVELTLLDPALAADPEGLRARLKRELRMLHWLKLDNQYAFVRDSAMRTQPALSPLIRLIDAKLDFLTGELFDHNPPATDLQHVEMSATGLAFEWPESLPPDALCLVRIDPAGSDAPLNLPAVVQRGAAAAEPPASCIVVEFFALTEDETDALASWIVARQARALSRQRSAEDD